MTENESLYDMPAESEYTFFEFGKVPEGEWVHVRVLDPPVPGPKHPNLDAHEDAASEYSILEFVGEVVREHPEADEGAREYLFPVSSARLVRALGDAGPLQEGVEFAFRWTADEGRTGDHGPFRRYEVERRT